jgi:hypothetical protein
MPMADMLLSIEELTVSAMYRPYFRSLVTYDKKKVIGISVLDLWSLLMYVKSSSQLQIIHII